MKTTSMIDLEGARRLVNNTKQLVEDTSGGLKFVISDIKPKGTNVLWLDTSDYEKSDDEGE